MTRHDTTRQNTTRSVCTVSPTIELTDASTTRAAKRPAARPTTVVIRTCPQTSRRTPLAQPNFRPGRRRPESTYRRRRAVVGVTLAVLVATAVVVVHDVLVDPGGDPAFAAPGRSAVGSATVVARPGDTLWSIGEEHRGAVPIRRYVDALKSLNGGVSIQAGQSVLLP